MPTHLLTSVSSDISCSILPSSEDHSTSGTSPAVPATSSKSTTFFLDILETNLFVDADSLVANITAATKGPDGLLDWIELMPKFHGSLVKCTLRLISRYTATFKIASAKEALFTFLINLLNGASRTPFLRKTTSASNCSSRKKKRMATEKLKADAGEVVTEHVTTDSEKIRRDKDQPVVAATPKQTPLDIVPVTAIQEPCLTALEVPPIQTSSDLCSPVPKESVPPPNQSSSPHPPVSKDSAPSSSEPIYTESPRCPKRPICTKVHARCDHCRHYPSTGIRTTLNGNKIYMCQYCRFHRSGAYIHGYRDYDCGCG